MSQTSSGPPADDLASPVSPPLHEQGIIDAATGNNEYYMDTTQCATDDDLKDNYIFSHPATKKSTEPTLEHYLFFEELLKAAATLMDKVHKSASAAQNVRSALWEKTSMKVEECMPSKPKVNNITRTQPVIYSRPVNDSRAYSEVLRKANEGKQVSHAPQPIIAQEPLPCINSNRPAPAVTERVVYNSECSLSEIFQCLMDLANANPSHSHIILRAFGLAKYKMRSSQNKFDMSFHLFEAYTHVISNSEFCTA
ncbi:hypothetical protein CDAR_106431 [Caerostris darwini]|uniref:Uncharacterized protein n=1 Tax=Caerostris darwini TaxID=1538125 RepID=A0AAV4S7K1_9ARAC|nr:hypothetical protein CDAR_106431 [Caerostris darwini]